MSRFDRSVGLATCEATRVVGGALAPTQEDNMPRNHPVQDQLKLRATQLQREAEALPEGRERDALLHRVTKIESAGYVIDKWTSSPGLPA